MAHVVTGVLRRGGRALRSVGPATVAVTVVTVATRAGLAARREAIEIVHGLGATDSGAGGG